MAEWTQGEQQRTKLLQGKQYGMQLLRKERPMAKLLQGEQHKMGLPREEQHATELRQEEESDLVESMPA